MPQCHSLSVGVCTPSLKPPSKLNGKDSINNTNKLLKGYVGIYLVPVVSVLPLSEVKIPVFTFSVGRGGIIDGLNDVTRES